MSDFRFGIIQTNSKNENLHFSDYLIIYTWDAKFRMIQQGRFIFNNGYIADWSVASILQSGIAADEFNYYEKYFETDRKSVV